MRGVYLHFPIRFHGVLRNRGREKNYIYVVSCLKIIRHNLKNAGFDMLRVETNTLKHSGSWTAWPWRWHYDRSARR